MGLAGVVPAGGKHVHERWEHEEDARERRDPPGVLRTIAPIPSPKRPITVRKSAAPNTARATPGWENAMSTWWRAKIDWPTANAIRVCRRGEGEH